MKVSELIANFKTALAAGISAATIESARTVSDAVERVASHSSARPLIVLCPGGRQPLQTQGHVGALGGVVRQTIQVWVAASNGIAKRGDALTELADLAEETETACLAAEGDWQDPRLEGSDPAQLPDGYPLDAWLIRVSVIKE